MTTFTFQGPNGETVTLEGPEGATREQAAGLLRQRLGSAPAAEPKAKIAPLTADPREGMGAGEKFLVGMGESADSTGRGLASLAKMAGLGGERLDKYLQDGKENSEVYERNHPGGWATAGNVVGNVLQTAIPVSKAGAIVTKGAKHVLPRAVAGAAPLIGDVTANAGVSAAIAPENRGQAATLSALGAGGGHVLSKTLGGPVAPSIIGQEAIDNSIRLTPGQAGEGMMGTLVNAHEGHLAKLPIIGAKVRNARTQGVDDLMQNPSSHQFDPEDVLKMHRELQASPDTLANIVRVGADLWAGKVAIPAAVATTLGTSKLGAKLMLGQIPWQRFAREDPVMAGKVARMLSKAAQPSGMALEGSAAAQAAYDQTQGEQNAP